MDDKQCEIMTRFEYVFGCVAPMREMGEQELEFMYVCVGCVSKGGEIAQRGPRCVCGLGHM